MQAVAERLSVMAGKFELKTRYQFTGIISKRDRWRCLRSQPAAKDRWERWTGPYWARHNCALDEVSGPASWQSDTLARRRTQQLQCHMAAAQMLMRLAKEKPFLVTEDVLEIHRSMLLGIHPSAGSFRQRETESLGEGHEPTEVELVGAVVENALDWFRSDSFAEMHEVEKAALTLIKLVDIQPFDEGNGKTLRLLSNFFLLRADYPPAVISPAKASQYAIAIQNSLRFDTQLMIDLITEAVDQGLAYLLDEPAAPPKLAIFAG